MHSEPRNMRHEKKYVLTRGVYEALRRRCAAVMKSDEHSKDGGYRVTSLYFEDVHRSSYHDKLNGVNRRRRYRVRVYDLSPERITLEGKFKENEYVYKTAAPLEPDEYHSLLRGDYTFLSGREDLKNFYAYAKTGNPRPAAIVDYFREAYVAEAGNVRVTFDKEISAGFGSSDLFQASYSQVSENNVVLEIKFDGFIPAYIQQLFTGFPLTEEPVSKYMLCADKFMEVEKRCML